MNETNFDLLVIGGGSAGVRAARLAAEMGARVGLADPHPLGGTCVNAGCVPKKLLWYAGQFAVHFEEAANYGWPLSTGPIDWSSLVAAKDRGIARLNGYYDRILREAGVKHLPHTASFIDPYTVDIGGVRYQARHVLIATGARPAVPDYPGWELGVTSNEIFHLPSLPARVLVVGGGYIGLEFAGIFRNLGCETTLVHRGWSVLRGFDSEATEFLTQQIRARGIAIRLTTSVVRVEASQTALKVTLDDGHVVETDLLLNAVGRVPNTLPLAFSAAGIEVDARGAIKVDADYRTNVSHVHAIGDVTARMQLTPVALAEASIVVRRLFGQGAPSLDYDSVPTAVFSTPNLSAVGLTENEARHRYGDVDVFTKNFSPLQHMLSGSTERVFMKLIALRNGGRIVGAHMVGPEAPEIIQGVAIAMRAGATKVDFDTTLGIHPTAAEEFVSMRTVR